MTAPRTLKHTRVPLAPAVIAMFLLAWVALFGVCALVYFAWLGLAALWDATGWMW